MTDEQEDLISQFLSDSDVTTEEKQLLHWSLPPRLKAAVLKLADWCYDEGYDDGEAGRQ